MARKTQNPTHNDQEEMTVVLLRFKGGGETLRKGFDTVSQAIAALGQQPAIPQRRIAARPANELPDGQTDGSPEFSDSDQEEEIEEGVAQTQRQSASGGVPRKRPKFLSNFNLDGDGTVWMDYASKRKPRNEYDKYLVAALWLTKHGSQEVFTAQHLFTCIRSAGWGDGQADFTQPLRKMKHEKSYFDNPEPRRWKLTRPGTEAAEAIPKKDE